LEELVRNAIELGGFRASIVIEPTLGHEPSLELVNGYTFELQPAFLPKSQPTDPRCACIDGYVETVSELHHLLTEASETRDWVIVFLRGMADDVKHTLKVNHDRGTLNVIPVVVDFDLAGLNTLNDIAAITGTDLISSNKGDVISSIRLSALPRIDRFASQDNRLIMRNASTKAGVQQHLKNLRTRREGENVTDIAHLLDRRIRSLSSNHVILRLPQDRDFIVASQAIDVALRNLRSTIEYGLSSINGRSVPTLTLIAAKTYTDRCLNALSSLGCVVTSQEI
jgi:chaperonin GroEL (HSP60 family)